LARAAQPTEASSLAQLNAVVNREQLQQARQMLDAVVLSPQVRAYIRDLLRATRGSSLIVLGAGPRAGVHLVAAARWAALFDGRGFVTPDDVLRVRNAVLCHRLLLTPEMELDGVSSQEVMDRVASSVAVPR
jgi:MoxR-like ATPase